MAGQSGDPSIPDRRKLKSIHRRALGAFLAIWTAGIGVEAIVSRDTSLWGQAAGASVDYSVRGTLAMIMGVGWLFAALASLAGLAASDRYRSSRAGHAVTSIAFLVFAACFVLVATRAVLLTYFPDR
jgi:hypothetical protein